MRRLFVAGGAGFIGSNFIRYLLRARPDVAIVNFDALTYAGNPDNVRDVRDDARYAFVHGSVADRDATVIAMRGCDAVINFAAASHVDRSIEDAGDFIDTNVRGAHNVLAAARELGVERVLHISTDEVYGPATRDDPRREPDAFRPRSPYAASKAAGDLMCRAFFETYGLPVVVARPANNVGPYQHPEKAVPLFVTNALAGEPLPVYGEGLQERDRLYVEDNVRALLLLLERGEPGEAYNIQADNHRTNIDVARAILDLLDRPYDLIRFVEDRAGHDQCYYMDWSKIRALGWQPERDFEQTLEATVRWYRDNPWWWERVKSGEYRDYYERQYGERLAGGRAYSA
ncbi:MAG TPA: dTDP-glucose 4,6-dehydratase [Dehalococcoidia bacterium]|nr:dTDP-glucose 4,6-dehydratase [Dehalococcoidia bacterium]